MGIGIEIHGANAIPLTFFTCSISSSCNNLKNPMFDFFPNRRRKPNFPALVMRNSKNKRRSGIVACSKVSNPLENSSADVSSAKEAVFDLKLPRRNLIVQFTCNECGERTERTINRVAYERGTVFVQCAGCLVHHKLVDNLGLVMEYDLREELDMESDGTRES